MSSFIQIQWKSPDIKSSSFSEKRTHCKPPKQQKPLLKYHFLNPLSLLTTFRFVHSFLKKLLPLASLQSILSLEIIPFFYMT